MYTIKAPIACDIFANVGFTNEQYRAIDNAEWYVDERVATGELIKIIRNTTTDLCLLYEEGNAELSFYTAAGSFPSGSESAALREGAQLGFRLSA